MTGTNLQRSAIRVGLLTAIVLLVPLVAMQFTDEVAWTPFDFALAAALLAGAGCLLELAVTRSGGIAHLVAAAAVGSGAIALGLGGDAPGLVLFGLALIAAAAALGARAAARRRA